MIKDLKTYIKTVNKSLTSSVSGAEDTKVVELRQATLKGSKALPLLPMYTMTGKYTDIPFIHLPDDDDTTYRIGGLNVEKSLINTSAELADETTEDASPNMEVALDRILTSQVRLKVENYIADKMTAVTAQTGVATSKTFDTIVEAIKKFPRQTMSIEGQFVALVSPLTHFTILGTMDNAHREMVKQGIITLVPMNGMGNDDMIVLHTQGVAIGFDIYELEKERKAGDNKDYLLAQLTVGFGYDADYLKHISLS